ncbi:MAG: hypothetical protein AB7V18_01230 [Pyrinomonadaceae bacterium]
MKYLIYPILVIWCFSLTSAVAQKAHPDWYMKMKRIEPLVSNYDVVADVFERPAKDQSTRTYGEYIDSFDGKFFIVYATGKCVERNGQMIGWKVPEWTVIEISYTPRKRMKRKHLPFELSGFRSYEVSDVPGAFIYENDKVGLSYGLRRNGTVEIVSFDPPEGTEHLHC